MAIGKRKTELPDNHTGESDVKLELIIEGSPILARCAKRSVTLSEVIMY